MKKFYIIILIFTSLLTVFLAYEKYAYLNITVKFDDLEPFEKQIPVFYKGFRIGKTVKIYPDKDYIYSYVDIKISPHDVRFPDNIEARLESGASGDYISIVPPSKGRVITLKDGDIIKGEINPDLNRLITETLGSGNIAAIMDGASNVMVTADKTMKELTELFSLIGSVIEDVSGDLKKASSNIADTTQNLSSISSNINTSLDKDTVNFSVKNLKETTANIKEISENLEKMSEQINQITVPRVNKVLCETEQTMNNTSELTEDIKNSVKERKGITRLLLGGKNN